MAERRGRSEARGRRQTIQEGAIEQLALARDAMEAIEATSRELLARYARLSDIRDWEEQRALGT